MKILNVLHDEGRISAVDLAAKVGLSPIPCIRRQRLLEESGIVEKYTAVINQRKAGYPVSVFLFLSLSDQSDDAMSVLEAKLTADPQVIQCVLLSGDADYMVHIVAKDIDDYEFFLKTKVRKLKGISSMRSHFVLRDILPRRAVKFL